MSVLLPQFRIKVGSPIGNELFFAFPEIYQNEKTFLDADVASGASSISANGVNFSVDQYVVIGQPGFEKTEIIKLHASTVPTATTITLATALQFAHNRGDLVQFIPYNQIVTERSTDSGATYSALAAVGIRPDSIETYLQRTADDSTDLYRFRFYNSTSALSSAYSDTPTASGYADNSVYAIKKRALMQMGEKYTDLITNEFLNDALSEGRRIVDQDPRILRWSFRTKFDQDVGDCIPGRWSISAPTDLRDRNTNKNILSLRIGRQNRPCVYQDENRFNQNYLNIGHTTLGATANFGDATATLTSSGDFDESGNITIAAETVAEASDIVAYTSNNEATGVLSGVTGIIAGGHASGRDVWQNATYGTPIAYTISNGTIYFDLPFSDSIAGENIKADYYQSLTPIVNDNATVDEPFYDMYVPYLKYKIKYLKANGAIDKDTDSDYKDFLLGLNQLITQEMTGQRVQFYPNVDGFLSFNH